MSDLANFALAVRITDLEDENERLKRERSEFRDMWNHAESLLAEAEVDIDSARRETEKAESDNARLRRDKERVEAALEILKEQDPDLLRWAVCRAEDDARLARSDEGDGG